MRCTLTSRRRSLLIPGDDFSPTKTWKESQQRSTFNIYKDTIFVVRALVLYYFACRSTSWAVSSVYPANTIVRVGYCILQTRLAMSFCCAQFEVLKLHIMVSITESRYELIYGVLGDFSFSRLRWRNQDVWVWDFASFSWEFPIFFSVISNILAAPCQNHNSKPLLNNFW